MALMLGFDVFRSLGLFFLVVSEMCGEKICFLQLHGQFLFTGSSFNAWGLGHFEGFTALGRLVQRSSRVLLVKFDPF